MLVNSVRNHALNTDELSELLALRGLNVSRKILVQDIATLCDNGYEVLSYSDEEIDGLINLLYQLKGLPL